jgi:hypothetical protein
MADDLTNRGPADRSRINMHEDYEVRYWTKALGVSKEELQRLVDKHGNSATKIKEALGISSPSPASVMLSSKRRLAQEQMQIHSGDGA